MKESIAKFSKLALKERKKIKAIVLFGSTAKGKEQKDSDIDLLIIWQGNKREGWRKLEEIAFNVLLETEDYLSLKVLTPEEVQTLEKKNNPFIKEIMKEGIRIA